jgi:hypothetical protein
MLRKAGFLSVSAKADPLRKIIILLTLSQKLPELTDASSKTLGNNEYLQTKNTLEL